MTSMSNTHAGFDDGSPKESRNISRSFGQHDAYRSGAGVLTHTDSQEEMERAKAGLAPVEEDVPQGYDPRGESPRADVERPAPRSPYDADRLLADWYAYRVYGRIPTAGLCRSEGGAEGADEGMLAALYVETTSGYSHDAMRPVLMHRLDGKPWATWYGPPSRALAAAMYDGFRVELTRRLEREPFVVHATAVRTPDHLEAADAANEVDPAARNRNWGGKVA